VVEAIRGLLDQARRAAIPVIYTTVSEYLEELAQERLPA
jgi:nicotinamidase-related amidase